MDLFDLGTLMERASSADGLYHEFLRTPALSMGIYMLEAGATDPQQPHAEAEVYLIANGRGVINVDGNNRPVQPGSIVYVDAGVDHHFHSIIERLEIVVFFAPAESG